MSELDLDKARRAVAAALNTEYSLLPNERGIGVYLREVASREADELIKQAAKYERTVSALQLKIDELETERNRLYVLLREAHEALKPCGEAPDGE